MSDRSKELEAALFALEAMLDRRGWHDHSDARLWWVRDTHGRLLCRAPSAPLLHSWKKHGAVPTLALEKWSLAMEYWGIMKLAPPDFVGVAWSMEAWGVRTDWDAMSLAERDQFEEYRQRREFYQHPDRVETRHLCGALVTGETVAIIHDRGDATRTMWDWATFRAGRPLPFGDEDSEQVGIVPAALRRLCGLDATPVESTDDVGLR